MNAVVYHRYGSPDELRLEEVEPPRVERDDDVLVKVHATSINSWDWDLLRGRMTVGRRPRHPVMGADVAGRVEAVGGAVTRLRPGDDVFGDVSGHGWGGLGEYVCVPERALAAMPTGLSFEQAAAVQQAGVLALQGLSYRGEVQRGEHVLLVGAGGGVGTLAVQMAKASGAVVTGVDSAGKLDMLRSLGADEVIDYEQESFAGRGPRYDRIVDVVLPVSIVEGRRALRPGGIYGVIGGSLPRIAQAALVGLLLHRRRVGVVIHRPGHEPLEQLTPLLEAGTVVPVIDSTYALKDARRAFERYGTGEFRGKIVLAHGP
jgi:NADPH:quinone reductase-like Zn-dependent oxidoreductase